MAWTVVSAADVGSPQLRARWFCLCVRRGYRHRPITLLKSCVASWSATMPPITAVHQRSWRARLSMLGNAIVPDCARLAFARVYSGFKVTTFSGKKFPLSIRHSTHKASLAPTKEWPKHGIMHRSGVMAPVFVERIKPVLIQIVLDPSHYTTTRSHRQAWLKSQSVALDKKTVRNSWPTPRAGSTGATHALTERSKKDLATAALFASSVGGKRTAKTRDGDGINIHFVEWLMGYKPGHTGH
jgi:site-specific DNA-cytosine methylase